MESSGVQGGGYLCYDPCYVINLNMPGHASSVPSSLIISLLIYYTGMADLVLDSHRRRTPLDHPDQSVTSDKVAPQEHITFELLTEDPPLVPGRWWIRSDTKELRYTIDGVKVHVIPLPFFPWSIDKYMLIQLISLVFDSHSAITLSTTLPTITVDSHSATAIPTTLPTITVEYELS